MRLNAFEFRNGRFLKREKLHLIHPVMEMIVNKIDIDQLDCGIGRFRPDELIGIPCVGGLVIGVGAIKNRRLASGMAGSRPHVKIQRFRLQVDGCRTVGCNCDRPIRPARLVLRIGGLFRKTIPLVSSSLIAHQILTVRVICVNVLFVVSGT